MSNILVIGGSGFVSGTIVRNSISMGHKVWTLTRNQRPLHTEVIALTADRTDPVAFAEAVTNAQTKWDLVVDCIGYNPKDIKLDISVLSKKARHLVFISTDFVYDPTCRRFPQTEETDFYLSDDSYGGLKRKCEQELMNSDTGDMAWTVVRCCHIYGPGSELGCLPAHGRDPQLIARLLANEPLQLVGGGRFLQQPIFADDLAQTILSMERKATTYNQIFCVAGSEIVESCEYYRIIANILGVNVDIGELPINMYLREHPESVPFLCHRIYDLQKLCNAGVIVPRTSLQQGLYTHVEYLLKQKL